MGKLAIGLLLIMSFGWPVQRLSAQTILQQFTAVSAGAGETTDMDLTKPTSKGSLLIAMPELLSPGITVVSITDNAPGGNTWKQIPGATSNCANGAVNIWYSENSNPGATELKFHLSGGVRASLNSFLEVANVALSSPVDGSGVQVSNEAATSAGVEVGPKLTTGNLDFVIARYTSTAPRPSAVTPAAWKFKTSYVYQLNAPAGVYQPTLTGAGAEGKFCMSMAAFKVSPGNPQR
jgi:hypothetical protein